MSVFKQLLGISLVLIFNCIAIQAQDKKDNRMLISGQGWYGYDIEQLRPHQKSYGYMSYEVALGLQTEPADGNVYDRLF